MRLLVASFVAAFSIVPLYLALLALSDGLDSRLLLPLLAAALAIAVAAMVFVALPLHIILSRLDKARSYYYLLVGFVLPAVFTLTRNPFDTDVASWIKWQALAMGLLGASVAFIFWWIATGPRTRERQ